MQTFYLPANAFETLSAFTGILDALENAFIGAYLNATLEFAQMAADTKGSYGYQRDSMGKPYTSRELEYFAEVAGSIMGVESEHRVLGRVVSNTNPANNLNYEQTDGLTSVYNGKASAVVALTPFLAPGKGLTAYSLATALSGAGNVRWRRRAAHGADGLSEGSLVGGVGGGAWLRLRPSAFGLERTRVGVDGLATGSTG